MWRKVRDYISKYNLYYREKLLRYKSYKEIRTALILIWSWAFIVINFIIKLLSLKKFLTKVTYNLILIIIDWLIKKVWFLLYKKVLDTEELIYMFLWHITAL